MDPQGRGALPSASGEGVWEPSLPSRLRAGHALCCVASGCRGVHGDVRGRASLTACDPSPDCHPALWALAFPL